MRPGEEEAVIAVWQAAGLLRPWNDPMADIAFCQASGHGAVLVLPGADGGPGAIAAAVMVGHDGHRGAVYYVAVDPGRRRAGLGRALMAGAEAWLKTRGVWKLNLLVRADNRQVVRFYEAIGMAEGERIYMEKWLDPAPKGDAGSAPSP
nr:GNAT family acetyltransferase [Chelatococcus reniformis]